MPEPHRVAASPRESKLVDARTRALRKGSAGARAVGPMSACLLRESCNLVPNQADRATDGAGRHDSKTSTFQKLSDHRRISSMGLSRSIGQARQRLQQQLDQNVYSQPALATA
ncbi:MAG: hypothetical protein M1821_007938 [Bathelium mastoideum]|nr:MAG: hypothetical protein M1821_007938 [Bathelium mastoideum]